MNDITFVKFLGVVHPLMASIFSGSTTIPSDEIIVDTERGVNQYQVQFKNLFQIIIKPFNYIQLAMNNSIRVTPIHHNTPCTIYEK
jgi:hypothetical protein